MRPDDNVAIYNFHSKVELVQDFSSTDFMHEQAFDLKANGMTVLNDAIYKAAEVLSKRPEKRRAIIVLSDGADTMSKHSADKRSRPPSPSEPRSTRSICAPIDSNGKQRMQDQGVLKNFAEKTGGRFVATPGGVAMRDAFKRIVEELGDQYTITYSPSNTKKDGKWRAIRLDVSRPGLTVRTRKGYNAPKKGDLIRLVLFRSLVLCRLDREVDQLVDHLPERLARSRPTSLEIRSRPSDPASC